MKSLIITIDGPAASGKGTIAKYINSYDAFIALGCIIKGETKHYEFLAATVMNALRNISFETDTPIINGVLTTETIEQAVARAGKELNKGKDFARTANDLQDYYLEV